MNKSTEPDPKPFVFPTSERHPKKPEELPLPAVEDPSEDAIDAGIAESFPASDPVSVTVSRVRLSGDEEAVPEEDGKSTPKNASPKKGS